MPKPAARLAAVPPHLFAEIDKRKAALIAQGVDVISLGIGDPDLPTPDFILDAMARAIREPVHHRYPEHEGQPAFREAAADYYGRRFGVHLDAKREILALIGAKEGLAHLIWAYIDKGDVALVPDPAHPVYKTQVGLAGGTVYPLTLKHERHFLPNLDAIPTDVAHRAKLLFLNYPNNPTGAVADLGFYEEAVAFCRRHDILLVSDNAYSETTFDDYVAPSVLQVPGAKAVAVECWSLSKPFNMTGWRIGFAAGNAHAIRHLGVIKTNLDSGQFGAIQAAGIAALTSPEAPRFIAQMNEVYRHRRDMAANGLWSIGMQTESPHGTFYLWAPVPHGQTSAGFVTDLLNETGVVVTPGSSYGPAGEGYVRLALCLDEHRLQEALGRIQKYGRK
ncbi:MAG TPA: LL-diaminopimelate aminotransferase [Symbiobacteriaceae bacterium]|nr:LL-diaminopimelate aminotransferase [Symbiobacteriaceae bacterium]